MTDKFISTHASFNIRSASWSEKTRTMPRNGAEMSEKKFDHTMNDGNGPQNETL
jgi:hypothetical protein